MIATNLKNTVFLTLLLFSKGAMIVGLGLFLCGCAVGMKVIYTDGKITEIKRTGWLPGKTKIENCEIDTKLSIFDFNLLKSK